MREGDLLEKAGGGHSEKVVQEGDGLLQGQLKEIGGIVVKVQGVPDGNL